MAMQARFIFRLRGTATVEELREKMGQAPPWLRTQLLFAAWQFFEPTTSSDFSPAHIARFHAIEDNRRT